MPKKTKGTKGEAKGPQGKGTANGKAGKPAASGAYARFKGDFRPGTEIRSKNEKLRKFRTYGKLGEYLAKALAEGGTLKGVAAELAVTGSRVNELVHILRVERPAAKGKRTRVVESVVCGPLMAANVPIDPLTGKPKAGKGKPKAAGASAPRLAMRPGEMTAAVKAMFRA